MKWRTDGQGDRQMNRSTDGKGDRQINRRTDGLGDRQMNREDRETDTYSYRCTDRQT